MIGTLSSPSRDPGESSSVEAVFVPLSHSAEGDLDMQSPPSLYGGGGSPDESPFTGSGGSMTSPAADPLLFFLLSPVASTLNLEPGVEVPDPALLPPPWLGSMAAAAAASAMTTTDQVPRRD